MQVFRVLQAAMMLQILLGLWRFLALYTELPAQPIIWAVHPLLGIGIAVAALTIFRPRRGIDPTWHWTAARYLALVPLALGLAMRYGLIGGWPAVATHMLLGLTALGVIDSVIKQEVRRRSPGIADQEESAEPAPTV